MNLTLSLDVGVFNVIRYLLVTVITVPVLEFIVRLTVRASGKRHMLRGGTLRWVESRLGVVTVHGRYYNTSSRIVVYLAGACMIVGLSLIEFGTISVEVETVADTQIRTHYDKYVWNRTLGQREIELTRDHFRDDIRRQGATRAKNFELSAYKPQVIGNRNVSFLKMCVADHRAHVYQENLRKLLREIRENTFPNFDRLSEFNDKYKRVVKREVADNSPFIRLSARNRTVTLPDERSTIVKQTIYGAELPPDRTNQGLVVRNLSSQTTEALRQHLGVDVLVTGVEKVGGSLRPVGSYKSMVFNKYMGCVALHHGSVNAVCFLNLAEFRNTETYPSSWGLGCEGPFTEKPWGFEGGSIGSGNQNLTLLVAHGTFLNSVVSGSEDTNRELKGVRVLAVTSALAKLEVGHGSLHTISINNILYAQEMQELLERRGSVLWSTLTVFLDKFTSSVVDPTVVSRSQVSSVPVSIGKEIRPRILASALIGAVFLLLSEVVVLASFAFNRRTTEQSSEQGILSSREEQEMSTITIGDDTAFILRLAAEEMGRSEDVANLSEVRAGVGLIHGNNGAIRVGLVIDDSQSRKTVV